MAFVFKFRASCPSSTSPQPAPPGSPAAPRAPHIIHNPEPPTPTTRQPGPGPSRLALAHHAAHGTPGSLPSGCRSIWVPFDLLLVAPCALEGPSPQASCLTSEHWTQHHTYPCQWSWTSAQAG